MSKLTINSRSNKGEMINFIEESKADVKDKNLLERIAYTLKKATEDIKQVTKTDLTDLIDEIKTTLVPEPVLAPVENSVKPTLKSKSKKGSAKKEESKEEPEKEPVKEEPKQKKTKKTEPETVKTEVASVKSFPLATMFPETIEHKELGNLVARHEMTFDEFKTAINNGETLYIATYWTKRHIKQFSYADMHQVDVPKTGFPLDLDILVAIIACDKKDRIWTMSSYTEAMFRFEKEDFELVEDKDFSIRVSNGLEFEIYAPAK